MQIPLNFYNVSLWFGVTAVILLITAQFVSSYEGNITIFIDQRKLKNLAVVMTIFFIATLAISILGILTSL